MPIVSPSIVYGSLDPQVYMLVVMVAHKNRLHRIALVERLFSRCS